MPETHSSSKQNLRGITAILIATGLFVLNDTIMKSAIQTLPLAEAVAIRSGMASVFLLLAIMIGGQTRQLVHAGGGLIVLRAFVELAGTMFFISGLVDVPLGNMTAIIQIVPLIMTVVAVIWLGETVSPLRIIVLLAGLAGAIMIASPDMSGLNTGAIFAFATAGAITARDLLARRINHGISPLVVSLTPNLVIAALTGFWAFTQPIVVPDLSVFLSLALSGLFVALAYSAITISMRHGEMQAVAPFYYSQTFFAVISGFVFFHEWPSIQAWMGIALVMGAGMVIVLSARQKSPA